MKCFARVFGLASVLSLVSLQAQVLHGVTPRNGQNGPLELARWQAEAEPHPEDWPGGRAELIGLSLGGARNWGSLAEYGVGWLEDGCGWKGFKGKERMEIAVPMFPSGMEVNDAVWKRALQDEVMNPEVAADDSMEGRKKFDEGGNNYLGYFHALATNLVEAGYGKSILRLGWEFNGDWFEWGRQGIEDLEVGGEVYDHARAYRELFASIRDTMMSVEGAEFRWSWCASIGAMGYVDDSGKSVDYRAWFPGREKVDFVSVDYFDDEVRYYPGRSDGPNEKTLLRLTWLSHLLRVEGVETSLALLLEKLGADLGGKYPWAAHEFSNEQLEFLGDEEKFPTLGGLREFVLDTSLAETGRPGVQWFHDFAAEQQIGFLVSEWGVWENDRFEKPQTHFSGGDNAEYVRLFAEWIEEAAIPGQTVGALYFEEYSDLSQPGQREGFNHSLLKSFPKARAAYAKFIGKD